jgi:hypothetical protein
MRKSFTLNALLVLALCTGLFSCNVSRKIDKWVGHHYAETVPSKVKQNDFISFDFQNTIANEKLSVTERTRNQFIPALFYWQWKYETSSTLNVMLPANNFVNTFISTVNSKKLKEKLNGATLKITINANPADFRYQDNGWSVFVIFGAISHSKIYVEPRNPEFSIQYTVTRPSGETKTNSIAVANPNRQKEPKFFQSLKGAVNEYLSVNDALVKKMAQELADKLIVDLSAEGWVKN